LEMRSDERENQTTYLLCAGSIGMPEAVGIPVNEAPLDRLSIGPEPLGELPLDELELGSEPRLEAVLVLALDDVVVRLGDGLVEKLLELVTLAMAPLRLESMLAATAKRDSIDAVRAELDARSADRRLVMIDAATLN
jgi:hypothetical protein